MAINAIKIKICLFLTLSIFFVKCAVARSFKTFFILINISEHIFLKINTHLIKKTIKKMSPQVKCYETYLGKVLLQSIAAPLDFPLSSYSPLKM